MIRTPSRIRSYRISSVVSCLNDVRLRWVVRGWTPVEPVALMRMAVVMSRSRAAVLTMRQPVPRPRLHVPRQRRRDPVEVTEHRVSSAVGVRHPDVRFAVLAVFRQRVADKLDGVVVVVVVVGVTDRRARVGRAFARPSARTAAAGPRATTPQRGRLLRRLDTVVLGGGQLRQEDARQHLVAALLVRRGHERDERFSLVRRQPQGLQK